MNLNTQLVRAKILSYNAKGRTAQVHIHGLTDGASEGLTATFAYPVGDDDRDTERRIVVGSDVYVFFEDGDQASPVIAFYTSHSTKNLVDVRRIRQKNIELLAEQGVLIETPKLVIKADVEIQGNVTQKGDYTASGTVTGKKDVIGGGISTKEHNHQGAHGATSKPLG